jgi:hypothetical protein
MDTVEQNKTSYPEITSIHAERQIFLSAVTAQAVSSNYDQRSLAESHLVSPFSLDAGDTQLNLIIAVR